MGEHANLWWHTGDLGYLDADGYFYFQDRGVDRIRRGGENVSSVEVEQAVERHPEVAVAAAIATPAELGEDEIKIFVVPVAESTLSPAELSSWCEPQVWPEVVDIDLVVVAGELAGAGVHQ